MVSLSHTREEATEEVMAALVSAEEVLVDHVLPALLVDLGLEVAQEVGVVLAQAEILGGVAVPVLLELFDYLVPRRLGFELVRGVRIVSFLEGIRAAARAIESQ